MGNHLSLTQSRPGRTFELKVLIFGLLFCSAFGWLRMRAAILSWDLLLEYGLQPGPAYAALSGALWGLLALTPAVGLYFRRRWAPAFTRLAAFLLAGAYWLDRLLLARSPLEQDSWLFAAGLTLLLLLFTVMTLALQRQKRFFEG